MIFPKHIQQFFSNRKMKQEVLTDFKIGYNGKIIYPYIDANGIKSFNLYRQDPMSHVGPRFSYDKGSHVALYGIHRLKEQKTILICEGLNDCLSSWSAGVPAVTSTGGCMSFQESWIDLFKDKEVLICLDNDIAGANGMIKILKFIPTAYVVLLPEDVKDIGDFIAGGGNLQELIKNKIHFDSLEQVISEKCDKLANFTHDSYFYDAYEKSFKVEEKPKRKVGIETDDLERAKEYPITDLLKFNNSGFALCPAHNEKTPSLKYYPEQNRCYCFGGCGKSFDAIDIYKIIHNCSFKEAVSKMQ